MSILQEKISKKELLVSDGATGTNLIQRGLPRGSAAEEWVLSKPQAILDLHRDFVQAGSDILLTCTFGASELRLEATGLKEQFMRINQKAVELARQASEGAPVWVAASLGPLGQMLKPLGLLEESEAEKYYQRQAQVLSQAGADLLLVETQFDLGEAGAAVRGIQSVSDLPLIVSFSFDRGTRTMMGVSPASFAQAMNGLGLAGLGINCGKSLEDNLNALKELHQHTELPIWFKPNAGLPKLDAQGLPTYDVTPEAMADQVPAWLSAGASMIGGCCGTSPAHLKAIAEHARNQK